MPEQLGFDLPGITALGRADFLMAPSNALAVTLIENWESWSPRKLVITGPDGAGKTHLSHVWAALSDAQIVQARELNEKDVPVLAAGSVVVEDVPEIAQNAAAQETLFHLHNLVLAEGHALLMTGRDTPRHWGLALPDLVSRLEGAQTVALEAPDDTLLAAVLAKLLADRQLTPKPDVIAYLTSRIERSFAAAQDIVARLDAASLAQKKPITRRLASTLLDNPAQDGR